MFAFLNFSILTLQVVFLVTDIQENEGVRIAIAVFGSLLSLVDFYMIYLLYNLKFTEIIFQNNKTKKVIARTTCLIFFVIMFIRSLAEGPGRMGTEYAQILWGGETAYNLIGYCEDPGNYKM